MGKQTEIKQSPSDVRSKLEQFHRRSSQRKRLAPKLEEEIVEDIVVEEIIEPVIPETHEEIVQEEKEEIEFSRGYTNKGSLCIWYKGFYFYLVFYLIILRKRNFCGKNFLCAKLLRTKIFCPQKLFLNFRFPLH